MASNLVSITRRGFGETTRRGAWWLQSLLTFLGFSAFIVYSTWAAFQGEHYTFGPYLSPMYSPLIWEAAGQPLSGQVLALVSQADIQKNTLSVKVSIDSPPATIRPEMLAQVTFLAPQSESPSTGDERPPLRLLVPRELIAEADGGHFVWVAADERTVAKRRSVQLGSVTAGGLVFIGGSMDEMFHAFDSATGELLWEYKLPAGGYATPSTYMAGGKQFVIIAAGGAGKLRTKADDQFVAFALP